MDKARVKNFMPDKMKKIFDHVVNSDHPLIYLGIGTCLRKSSPTSDQQIPACLFKSKSSLAILFDPEFRHDKPLFAEMSPWSVKYENELEGFVYQKENVSAIVCSGVIEHDTPLFQLFSDFLEALVFQTEKKILLGVFAMAYMMVPENKDIIELYHMILDRWEKSCSPEQIRLRYFHLADYAESQTNSKKTTLVWLLKTGQRFSQDEALFREISHYGHFGNGPTFGVSCYLLIPGVKFSHLVEKGELFSQVKKRLAMPISSDLSLNSEMVLDSLDDQDLL